MEGLSFNNNTCKCRCIKTYIAWFLP
ncbi:hypothetical protein D3Z45_08585 [Lachnospiraceae bacterium]|nr:hypothetical protein [Lachnospiraceae bacterium]